jgi:hypothetical protein
VKSELRRPTILALYDLTAPTKVVANASSFGLGTVLMQKKDKVWRLVIHASRTTTETESRYASIQKEMLALTWACERFAEYILGIEFQLETNNKSLVPILGDKPLDSLPPQILLFCLTLARFDYSIAHVLGKVLCTSDILSRAPVEIPCNIEKETIMECA